METSEKKEGKRFNTDAGRKKAKDTRFKTIRKIIIIAIFMLCVCFIINVAPNYVKNEITDKTNVIINNNNITGSLKGDIYIKDGVVYMSEDDIENFFDGNIYYDEKYEQIITGSEVKIAALAIDKNEMYVNSSKVSIKGKVEENNGVYYLPISEMQNVYNIELNYIEETDRVLIDSLDREKKMASSADNYSVKSMSTDFSRTVDTVKKGENVVVIEPKEGEDFDGWTKIRTESGIIGYIKKIANIHTVREAMEEEKQIEGTISLVWDYYYSSAPNRTGKIDGINVVSPSFALIDTSGDGSLDLNIGTSGKNYIEWAKSNEYKIWAIVSNNTNTTGIKQTTSNILRDYKLRENLINNIVNMVIEYELDGINIDFENIYKDDKQYFSRFIIELAPRLKELGKVLSVDVTAPDGSDDWSLCYDRHTLGKEADYLIFMAYDQYGQSSTSAGTTAGADWIEVNLKKFVGTQEEVDPEKLILAMPLYTRLWEETDGELTKSTAIPMKNITSTIPESATRQWLEDVQQYYVEYTEGNKTYKMWIEDTTSLKAKFELMKKYKLAGAAYWEKDYETSDVWELVSQETGVN